MKYKPKTTNTNPSKRCVCVRDLHVSKLEYDHWDALMGKPFLSTTIQFVKWLLIFHIVDMKFQAWPGSVFHLRDARWQRQRNRGKSKILSALRPVSIHDLQLRLILNNVFTTSRDWLQGGQRFECCPRFGPRRNHCLGAQKALQWNNRRWEGRRDGVWWWWEIENNVEIWVKVQERYKESTWRVRGTYKVQGKVITLEMVEHVSHCEFVVRALMERAISEVKIELGMAIEKDSLLPN